jgi:hypothetical protein
MHFTNLVQSVRKSSSWGYPGRNFFERWDQREERKLPRINPADFGLGVTIAIVARSDPYGIYVSASDRSLSFDDQVPAIDDAIFKDIFFTGPWKVAFAAHYTSFVYPILLRAAQLLGIRGGNLTYDDLRKAMCDGYLDIIKEQATKRYLAKFGYSSVEEFVNSGPSKIGNSLYNSLSKKIEKLNFNIQFIVYGFDKTKHNRPYMFEVNTPGVDELINTSYFAVGSGTHMAMASLNLRPTIGLSPKTLVYRVCEAKFSAETADGVGKATSVHIMNKDGHSELLPQTTINKFREIWENWRTQDAPQEALDLLGEIQFNGFF